MSKINPEELKEAVKLLNTSSYENEDGEKVSFLETKIKAIGVSTDKLAFLFAKAIFDMEDDVAQKLPEFIIDFYNDNEFPSEEPTEEEPEKTKKEESAVKKTEEKKTETKKEAPKKEAPKKEAPKKEAPKKVAKKKEPAELSVFGHKMGSQAAKLDALLGTGKKISLEDLSKQSGRSELGVKSHIKHLIETRKLTINVKDNIYQYMKNK
jgi:hypothetical protein